MAVLKVIEILSDSTTSWEDATKQAIERANESVSNIRSAFVQHQTVTVKNGKVDQFRVNLKVTFEVGEAG
ncbi:dodecin family protein [Flavilitoribacter nigricans]|uniref:Dodecin n=1 Tax=Flavilitoribacter nigricans (strain ATCC 23147 / DSM 23189 / NBRC 102662 / NCIMB 1420 / SS-2) TaxID=1122177 RepID=A0A2D0NAE4_FLAN2|nr:dodecin family protein [Flavilitoribacter nigricans]PHN05457.1 dodecin [Flavilitoribacter nigricans DSM 23189 = NBRC 102662]